MWSSGRCASWLVTRADFGHTMELIRTVPSDPDSAIPRSTSRHAATRFGTEQSGRRRKTFEDFIRNSLRVAKPKRSSLQPSSFVNISRTPETRKQRQTEKGERERRFLGANTTQHVNSANLSSAVQDRMSQLRLSF